MNICNMLTFATGINIHNKSGANNLSDTKPPLKEHFYNEQDSSPTWLDFDRWSNRNRPAADDHRQEPQYQAMNDAGVGTWSAHYAPRPPPSERLPPWLAERNNVASLMGPLHRGSERSRSYVDEAEDDVDDDAAADQYDAQQAEQVEVLYRKLPLVGRDGGDSDQRLKMPGYLPSGRDQRTSHDINELNPDVLMKSSAREVDGQYDNSGLEAADEVGLRRVVNLQPSISDAFASDYQESLLALSGNRRKSDVGDESSTRRTVTPVDVIKTTASRLRSSARGRKRLMLEPLRDSPNSRKLHRKRVLFDKNPPESRIAASDQLLVENVSSRDVVGNLMSRESLLTSKQTSLRTQHNGLFTTTTGWLRELDTADMKTTIVGFIGSVNNNESGVTLLRRNTSRSTLYQIKKAFRDSLKSRQTNGDGVDKSAPTGTLNMESTTGSIWNLSAFESSSPSAIAKLHPLDTGKDVVARQSAAWSADSPVRSRNSEHLAIEDSRQYSKKGKHFDRSPIRNHKWTVNRRAAWNRGRKYSHRHRERRQAASTASIPSSGSISSSSSGGYNPPAPQGADADRKRLLQLVAASMSDAEQAARHLTPDELNALLLGAAGNGNSSGSTRNAVWHVELNAEQKSFVTVIIAIAVIIAAGTLIFACIWCLLDQDGLCPAACCARCLGTPHDTFSPQRWWMEALAQRVENLEAAHPLIGSKKPTPVPDSHAAAVKPQTGKPTPLAPGKQATPVASHSTVPPTAVAPQHPAQPQHPAPAATPPKAPAKTKGKR